MNEEDFERILKRAVGDRRTCPPISLRELRELACGEATSRSPEAQDWFNKNPDHANTQLARQAALQASLHRGSRSEALRLWERAFGFVAEVKSSRCRADTYEIVLSSVPDSFLPTLQPHEAFAQLRSEQEEEPLVEDKEGVRDQLTNLSTRLGEGMRVPKEIWEAIEKHGELHPRSAFLMREFFKCCEAGVKTEQESLDEERRGNVRIAVDSALRKYKEEYGAWDEETASNALQFAELLARQLQKTKSSSQMEQLDFLLELLRSACSIKDAVTQVIKQGALSLSNKIVGFVLNCGTGPTTA